MAPGHQRADHRDEGTEEDQHAERQRERHADDGGADADTDRVHERDEHLDARVLTMEVQPRRPAPSRGRGGPSGARA